MPEREFESLERWNILLPDIYPGWQRLCSHCVFQKKVSGGGICLRVKALDSRSGEWMPLDQTDPSNRLEIRNPLLDCYTGKMAGGRERAFIICSDFQRKPWHFWVRLPFRFVPIVNF